MISVVVCTYNRSQILPKMIHSLIDSFDRGLGDLEIIIIDNNSSDETKSVVDDICLASSQIIRYFFEPQQGLNYARNRGIKESQGDIITFTDDDVEIHEDWLENIWKCFSKYDCDAVGAGYQLQHV